MKWHTFISKREILRLINEDKDRYIPLSAKMTVVRKELGPEGHESTETYLKFSVEFDHYEPDSYSKEK